MNIAQVQVLSLEAYFRSEMYRDSMNIQFCYVVTSWYKFGPEYVLFFFEEVGGGGGGGGGGGYSGCFPSGKPAMTESCCPA